MGNDQDNSASNPGQAWKDWYKSVRDPKWDNVEDIEAELKKDRTSSDLISSMLEASQTSEFQKTQDLDLLASAQGDSFDLLRKLTSMTSDQARLDALECILDKVCTDCGSLKGRRCYCRRDD